MRVFLILKLRNPNKGIPLNNSKKKNSNPYVMKKNLKIYSKTKKPHPYWYRMNVKIYILKKK